MARQAETLRATGHARTSETYVCALRCFVREMGEMDIRDISADTICDFEARLRQRGLKPNTTSFYLRVLKAAYRRAVGELGCADARPFARAYTGVARTAKRGLTAEEMRRIVALDLKGRPKLAYARDIFIFLFLARGMSLIDAAFLQKSDLCDGVLVYRRRKTGQQLRIKWLEPMQRIASAYDDGESPYLLPMLRQAEGDERRRHLSSACAINRGLKAVGRMAGVRLRLTTYVSRHSWASIAKRLQIPLPVISECMGHDSERTTSIYLANLDASALDQANDRVARVLRL